MGERLAKRMARAGLCSRRDAEKWIESGRVQVDGSLVTTPAFNVSEDSVIQVDGQLLAPPTQQRIWLYYKPVGLVTTHKDPEGRETVFEALQSKKLPRVISVGRLDLNSEGLLILTNDGEFARQAELPSNHWPRTYRVRVFGYVNELALKNLEKGIVVEGVRYGAIQAELTRVTGRNAWLLMTLHEGKNREIRKILNHLDLQVSRLIRVSYGPYELGDMEPGDIREITEVSQATSKRQPRSGKNSVDRSKSRHKGNETEFRKEKRPRSEDRNTNPPSRHKSKPGENLKPGTLTLKKKFKDRV